MISNDCKISHLRNLIVLADADGIKDSKELQFIRDIMNREQLTEKDYEYCSNNRKNIEYSIPENQSDRLEYLHDMIQLMMLDGDCDDREIEYCNECARMMEIQTRDNNNLVNNMMALIADEMKLSGINITRNRYANN